MLIWELLIGAVYVLVGSYLLVNPVAGLVSLTFVLAVYLFAEGVLEFIMGFGLRFACRFGLAVFLTGLSR